MRETWKTIPGFSNYEVSDLGRVLGSGKALASRFGVTPAAISAIRNGKLWRHG